MLALVASVLAAWCVQADPVVHDAPFGSVVPRYRYDSGVGRLPFYGEYYAQSGDGASEHFDNPARWHENLEAISQYATVFDVILRYDDLEHLNAYADLATAAVQRRMLVGLHSYGIEGVDRCDAFLDLLESRPDGQRVIRNIYAVKLADEPYLGGREPEEMDALTALFAERIKSRYAHIMAWINFAVSHETIRTWGTGSDGRKRLPYGLDIVSIDVYAYVGNGTVGNWGSPDLAAAEAATLAWMDLMFRDETYPWNQTRMMREAIDAVYGDGPRPMMYLLGCSGYVEGITHPTPPSILDRYFELVRDTEWCGLIWWCYEDFKDSVGGRRPEVMEAHRRHGAAIREQRLFE